MIFWWLIIDNLSMFPGTDYWSGNKISNIFIPSFFFLPAGKLAYFLWKHIWLVPFFPHAWKSILIPILILFALNLLPQLFSSLSPSREVIRPDTIEEVIVSCVIKHLGLIDSLQSLVNLQYREEHKEEYELLCKIMAETYKKINAMERQLQVCRKYLQIWCNSFE